MMSSLRVVVLICVMAQTGAGRRSDPPPAVDSVHMRSGTTIGSTDTSKCFRLRDSSGAGVPAPSAAQAAQFGPEILAHVRAHEVCIGMTRSAVQAAWGLPQTMDVYRDGSTRWAQWAYKTQIVELKNDSVAAVH